MISYVLRIFYLHCTNKLGIEIKELSFTMGGGRHQVSKVEVGNLLEHGRSTYNNAGGRQVDGKRRWRNLQYRECDDII